MWVKTLGAWCELSHEDDGGRSFEVFDFAELDDGRRLRLSFGRGFSTSYKGPLSFDKIEQNVLMTVLPDDDSSTEQHPWESLAEALNGLGVTVTAAELKRLPYSVKLGPRLEAVLDLRKPP